MQKVWISILLCMFCSQLWGQDLKNSRSSCYSKWLSDSCSIACSPTIVESSGRLLVVWHDKKSNKLLSRYCEHGSWSEIKELFPQDNAKYSHPVLLKVSFREIWLFYRKQLPRETNSRAYVACSFNSGLSWSEHRLLPPGIEGTKRNPPYLDRMRNRLLVPAYNMYPSYEESNAQSAVWIENYYLNSKCWSGRTGPIQGVNQNQVPIEPAIVQLSNTLALFCRNAVADRQSHICMSISSDWGNSWSKLRNLPWGNYNSSLSVQTGKNGKLFIFSNSSENGYDLTCYSSFNEGVTWNPPKLIDEGYSVDPSAYLDRQNYMHLVYTGKDREGKQRIRYLRVKEEALLLGTSPKILSCLEEDNE